MKKTTTKSRKSTKTRASGRRPARTTGGPVKKKAKASSSPVKKTTKTAKRTVKKTTRSSKAVTKKSVKTAKSPSKKIINNTKSKGEKLAKSAGRTAKKPARSANGKAIKIAKTTKGTVKKAAPASKRPVKRRSGAAKSPARKSSKVAKGPVKKTTTVTKKPTKKTGSVSKPRIKKTAKSAGRIARKPTRSTRGAAQTRASSSKKPGKNAGKIPKSSAKKSAKSTKVTAQKPRKSTRSPKTAPAPRGTAAKSAEKAIVKFDPLQRYLTEISTYKLLTREEERELGIRVREKGDKDAAYRLVTSNLRLVVKIALEFQRVWMQNLLDLIQEGNIGLMQAVKKFDPYKNVKFSYYASFWIKAYILKFIMDNWRLVKIGTTQGQRKLFFKLKKEKQKLIDEGFEPKPKLLSERLGVSEREIIDMDQRLDGWDVSLDAPLKEDSDTERIEFVSTNSESIEDKVSKKEIEVLLHNKIAEFRKKMTPRELEIFDLRIFSDNPVTLQEIGDRYGISRERVRQVEKNIIKKMREFFKREIPDFASYTEGSRAD